MMESSGRDILGDVTHGGTITVLEGFSHESSKESVDSNPERLLDEGKGSLCKEKPKFMIWFPHLHQMQNGYSRLQFQVDFVQIMQCRKLWYWELIIPGRVVYLLVSYLVSNESEDISTESDEAIEKNYKWGSGEVTDNLIHMVKGQDMHSSSLRHHDADILAWKENMVMVVET